MKKQISLFICALLMSIGISAQNINTCAGTGGVPWNGDNIHISVATVGAPKAVAYDQAGNMYVASLNRIRKITPAGNVSTFAGTGVAGFSGDGSSASLAQINDPRGLTFDASGNLYIADHGNLRIRKVTPAGIITTFAGGGTGNDNVAATSSSLTSVMDVVADAIGNVYYADAVKHKIRKINSLGIISTYAGTGVSSSTGDGGIAMFCTIIAPTGLAIDGANNLYIADSAAHRVRMITTSSVVSTFAGNGTWGPPGNGGPATSASIIWPHKVCCKGNTVYISCDGDGTRYVTSGVINVFAGNGSGFAGDGGPAALAKLHLTRGLSADPYGNIAICDAGNSRVRLVGCNVPTLSVATSTAVLCVGNQATLTSTGATNYTWSPGNMSGPVVAVSPTVNTTYSVNSTYYVCSVATSTITQAVSVCTVATGINEMSTKRDVRAYPNPFQDKITVEVDADVKRVEVIDLNGRVVLMSNVLDAGVIELSTETIAPGIYVLQLIGHGVRTTKIVK